MNFPKIIVNVPGESSATAVMSLRTLKNIAPLALAVLLMDSPATVTYANLPDEFPVTDGLVLLLDAEAIETEGDNVTMMRDLSGRNNDALTSTNHTPVYIPRSAPSGTGTVRFNGIDHYMDVQANSADFDGRGKTSVAVFRPDSLGLHRVVNISYGSMDGDNPEAPRRDSAHSVYTHTSGAVRVENRTATGLSVAVSTPGGLVAPNAFIIGANRWAPNGDTLAVVHTAAGERLVGQTTGADADPAQHLRTRIGAAGGSSPANLFSGDLAGLAVFNRALTDAEMTLVEEFFQERYLHPVDPARSYQQWANSFDLEEGKDGPGDDANGDGVTNLEKFFLDSDPLRTSGAGRSPPGFMSFNALAYPLIYPGRRPDLSPVDFQVETSEDLIAWEPVPNNFLILDHPEGGQARVRIPIPLPDAPAQFLRTRLSFEDNIDWIRLGRRAYSTDLETGSAPNSVPPGTPVMPMWQAPYAQPDKTAGGFPQVSGAQHRVVWQPMDRSEGAFNHHAALTLFDGLLLAMWSNHWLGEDASGQRVLYSISANGSTWTFPEEMFPAPDEIRDRGEPGISLRPDRWVVTEGRCFAVAYSRTQGTPNSSFPVARELMPNGTLGKPFTLHPEERVELLPVYMRDSEPYSKPETAAAILEWYEENTVVSWWAQMGESLPRRGVDGANLIEPLTYKAHDGEEVLLLRFHPARGGIRHNNRMYVSFQDASGEWATPYPTNIPDSPNRTEPVVLTDGSVLLIGGQIAPELDASDYLFRDPLTVSVSRDGYTFERVYSLRHGAPEGYRFDGIGGRTGGFAYNSSIVKDGWLYTLYSVGKEDIEITRVPLTSLGL